MKDLFQNMGFTVSQKKEEGYKRTLHLYVISNPDGTPRWIWPQHVKQPLFLKFYNVSSWRSRLFNSLIQLFFFIRAQRFVFKKAELFLKENSDSSLLNINGQWAAFTGTTGPNNKILVYHIQNKKAQFIKIATTANAAELIANETKLLKTLAKRELQTFLVPEISSHTTNSVSFSDVSQQGRRSQKLSQRHLNTLLELNDFSAVKMQLQDYDLWQQMKLDFLELKQNNDSRLPKGIIRIIDTIIHSIDSSKTIELSLSHGDFTPWNLFARKYKLAIYDWELANPLRPAGFDAFHFITQQGILVERKTWRDILLDIHQQLPPENFALLNTFHLLPMEDYLRFYLLFNTVYYLKLYSQQEKWHEQVFWLLNVWNEALSTCIKNKHSQREILAMNLFDFLLPKNYAALKFPDIAPEQLSEFSDIDLCAGKEVNRQLLDFIVQHPLVYSVHTGKKSFMATHRIFCNDGSILCIDVIWKLKRKNLEMLEIKNFLTNTRINEFGIKMPQAIENSRYIGLFYLLNNAPIPEKYWPYRTLLYKSNKVLDILLSSYYAVDNGSKKGVLTYVKVQHYNNGLNYQINTLQYAIDTLRSYIDNRGMVITFSGVDGAGKSTVIDKIKSRLEKQLRQPVIVLRHRPSVLPILSALTKGKAAAEKASVERLPRTGGNKSALSSLLRFGYYYTDYVLGQFVVYFKYVLRGYIVLYDRYYFDFINDARRSNLQIPESISKAGFSLLLKPKYNFFLYAQPEVILNRKKELDRETIVELTGKYRQLFDKLGESDTVNTYKSIENLELDETINTIIKTITHHSV